MSIPPQAIIETTLEAMIRPIESMRTNWDTRESAFNPNLRLDGDESRELKAWCDEAIRFVKEDVARKIGIFLGIQQGSQEEVWAFPHQAYLNVINWFDNLQQKSGPISSVYDKPSKLPALSSPNVSDPTAPISVVVELWSYFRRIVRAQALAGRRRHGGRRSGRSAPSAQQLEIITNNAITSGLVKALSEIDRSLRHQWNTMTVSRRQELLIEVESFMMYAYGRSSSTVRDVLKNNGNHAILRKDHSSRQQEKPHPFFPIIGELLSEQPQQPALPPHLAHLLTDTRRYGELEQSLSHRKKAIYGFSPTL